MFLTNIFGTKEEEERHRVDWTGSGLNYGSQAKVLLLQNNITQIVE